MKLLATISMLALTGFGASALQAKTTGCTVADFKGVYGFTVYGLIQPGLAISGYFGRLGKITADGLGTANSVTLADYHGANQIENLSGPYTVTDNCYVKWTTYLASVNGFVSFEGAIAGNVLQLIVAYPPGAALVGFAEKQKGTGCKAGDLVGTYALRLTGEVEPGLPISGPFGRLGQLLFDGNGTAVATTIASYSGFINPENFTGTYTVSDVCHLTFQATLPPPAGFPITIEGEMSTDNSHVLLMVTAPAGAVVVGEMTKQ